jgi:lipopolysaccharide transport system permease protein
MNKAEGAASVVSSTPVITIRPTSGWASLRLREVWAYRELLYFFVWRNLKVRYRQTAIGALWAIFQPVALVVIFTLILGRVPGLAPEGVPYALFALAGLVPWTLFSQGLNSASSSVVDAANMVQKVYFPRLLLPISAALSYLLDFAIATLLLLVLVLIGGYGVSLAWLAKPLLAALVLATVLGAGFWLASLNVRYRDIKHAVPFVIQLWFFATPIVYSSEIVPDELWLLYHLNPMAGVVEGFRWALFANDGAAPIPALLLGTAVALMLLLSGQAYFRRTERTFADVI